MSAAIQGGFRALRRNWGLAPLLLVVNLLTAGLLAAPMVKVLEQALKNTDAAPRMLEGFDYPWWSAWSDAQSGWTSAFRPDLFGIGFAFKNLDLLLKGYFPAGLFVAPAQEEVDAGGGAREPHADAVVLALGVLYMVEQAFLAGGVLGVFRQGGGWTSRGLLHGSGFYFARLMRVTLLALAVDYVIFRFNAPLSAWVDERARNAVSESGALAWQMGRHALLLLALLFVHMVASYAKIIVVVEQRLSAVLAFVSSLSFCLGNLLRTAGHYLAMAAMGIGLTALWAVADRQWPVTGYPTLAVALLLAEGLVLVRIALRLALLGGQVALYGDSLPPPRGGAAATDGADALSEPAAPLEFPERFNMAWYFLDRNLEEGRGNKTCLYYRDEAYTYREVQARANRFANALRSLGIDTEDRVLLVLPDSPAFAFAWFGAAKLGAVIGMVNPALPAEDYVHYFQYTRARAAVVDESTLDRIGPLRDSFPSLRHLIVVGRSGPHVSFEEACARASDRFTNADTHRWDPAIWLFTSGSTGKPKAAVHLQQDLPWNTERYARQVLGIRADDVTASVPKLFFGYATGTNLLFPFSVGGAAVLFSERSEPGVLFDVIERYKPSILTSVPTMIGGMLNHPGGERRDLSSLRLCLSAGEALPAELHRRWQQAFGVEILDGIGSAEMFHIYISNNPGAVVPGSLGRLVPGYEARIVDAEGRDVPAGEAGTLWIKGGSAAALYWQAREKSKEVLRGDWVVTGDHMRRDGEGLFWYEGRSDDMLKVGGIFVSPYEVENCLLQHPRVAECAVIGYKGPDGLVKPKAYVVPHGGGGDEVLARELQDFVKTRLAAFKYPRSVEFAASLPKNDRGKIDRRRLGGRDPQT